MTDLKPAHEKALMLAALCGFKIALGPAFLRTSQRSSTASGWTTAAIGEMTLDKLGVFPARYRPMLLIPHTVAGAWTARESLKEDGVDDPAIVAAAAVVAAGVSATLPLIRITLNKVLGIPELLLGVAEDYVALRLGSQAVGMSMEQVGQIASESVKGFSEQVKPTLEEYGEKLRPALKKVGIDA